MTPLSTPPCPDQAELRRIGRESGLAAGLAAVLAGLDPYAVAPGGRAVLPVADVPADARVVPHVFAHREGLALVRLPAAGGSGLPASRSAALAAVRCGVLERLLDAAAHRLARRGFGGVPLAEQQLVQGATADVVTVLHTAAATAPDAPAAALAAVHEQLTEAAWTVARFFGAEGFVAAHPVWALHLSALTADVWAPRAVSGRGSR
ncbi:hypothetical protein [Streptomyces sp. NPDC020996]|uniref:hypothetical protein n=1 Tax=Streptomyces sp. NPDC020996 TaxID=3154791 RepID=UPI0033E61127